MSDVFLEVVIDAAGALEAGIEGRDEIEEPLETALGAKGLGWISGGGGGSGTYVLDVEIEVEERLQDALTVIRTVLRNLNVPKDSVIKRYKPKKAEFTVYTEEEGGTPETGV